MLDQPLTGHFMSMSGASVANAIAKAAAQAASTASNLPDQSGGVPPPISSSSSSPMTSITMPRPAPPSSNRRGSQHTVQQPKSSSGSTNGGGSAGGRAAERRQLALKPTNYITSRSFLTFLLVRSCQALFLQRRLAKARARQLLHIRVQQQQEQADQLAARVRDAMREMVLRNLVNGGFLKGGLTYLNEATTGDVDSSACGGENNNSTKKSDQGALDMTVKSMKQKQYATIHLYESELEQQTTTGCIVPISGRLGKGGEVLSAREVLMLGTLLADRQARQRSVVERRVRAWNSATLQKLHMAIPAAYWGGTGLGSPNPGMICEYFVWTLGALKERHERMRGRMRWAGRRAAAVIAGAQAMGAMKFNGRGPTPPQQKQHSSRNTAATSDKRMGIGGTPQTGTAREKKSLSAALPTSQNTEKGTAITARLASPSPKFIVEKNTLNTTSARHPPYLLGSSRVFKSVVCNIKGYSPRIVHALLQWRGRAVARVYMRECCHLWCCRPQVLAFLERAAAEATAEHVKMVVQADGSCCSVSSSITTSSGGRSSSSSSNRSVAQSLKSALSVSTLRNSRDSVGASL